MCHEVAMHPEIQQRLHSEITEIEKNLEGKPISYETIQNLIYIDMIASETLRLWPPIPGIDRQVSKPYKMQLADGRYIDFKTNDVIWLPIAALHRDPNYWPEPERFDPERFSEENKKNIQPGTYTPFGNGPRACIASRFAMIVAKTVFYTLVRTYHIEQCPKTPNPLILQRNSINTKAEGGFWVRLRPRSAVSSTL